MKMGRRTQVVSFQPRPLHRRLRSARKTAQPVYYLRVILAATCGLFGLTVFLGQGTTDMLTGNVTHVRDGDTIEIGPTIIRLAGLNCPELGAFGGSGAKSEMQRLTANKRLVCTAKGLDRYDRQLASCTISGASETLSDHMIKTGYCATW